MDSITQTLLDSFIPEIVAQRALNTLEAEISLIPFVNKDFSTEVQSKGKTVVVPKHSGLQDNEKVAGQQVTLQANADTDVPISLSEHREATVLIEDVARALVDEAYLDGKLQEAMLTVMERAETYLFGVADGLTASIPSTVYTTANALDGIRKAKTVLNSNRAPKMNRGLFLSNEFYSTVGATNNLALQQNYGDNVAIRDGLVPRVLGFQAYDSLFTPVSGDNVTNLAIHRDAVSMVARALPTYGVGDTIRQTVVVKDGFPMRVTLSYDHKALGVIVTVDALYGASVLRNELGVKIISDESEES